MAAYYCMLNAAKSYLAYKSTTADDFVDEFSLHGISEDANDTGLDLDSIMVKHKQKGVWHRQSEQHPSCVSSSDRLPRCPASDEMQKRLVHKDRSACL